MNTPDAGAPTCSDYRGEMLLLSLHRRLADDTLSEEERQLIRQHIERLEIEIGMD